jgi:hypothetical protein
MSAFKATHVIVQSQRSFAKAFCEILGDSGSLTVVSVRPTFPADVSRRFGQELIMIDADDHD